LRQGFPLSSILFNICTEKLVREAEDLEEGNKVVGKWLYE